MSNNIKRAGTIIFALVLSLSLFVTGLVFGAAQKTYAQEDGLTTSLGATNEEGTLGEEPDTTETTTEETTTEPQTTEEQTTKQQPTTTQPATTQPATTQPTTQQSTTKAEQTTQETTTATPTTEQTTQETTTDETQTTTEEQTTQKETTTKKEEPTTPANGIYDYGTGDQDNNGTTNTTANITTVGADAYQDIGTVFGKPEKYGTLYWPLPAEYGLNSISSRYGLRVGQYSGMHRGLDIAAPQGTPIYACADGVVVASYFSDSAGNFTVIKHDDGIYTEYMHQSVRHVQTGDTVKAGQIIGLVGTTGWSTGPHLHIGVVISDTGYDISKRVDPLPYLTFDDVEHSNIRLNIKEEDLRIDYKDGKKITDVVKEDSKTISSLKAILSKDSINKVSFNGFTYKGYAGKKEDKLKEKNAISYGVEEGFNKYEDKWVKYETDDYDITIYVDATYSSTDKLVPLTFLLDSFAFGMDWSSYKKSDFKETYYEELSKDEGGYYAIDIHVDIFKHGTEDRIDLPEIYQRTENVEKAKSFKCLNEEFEADNLIIKNKKEFDKNENKNDKSSFITESGDIYSEYSLNPFEEVDTKGKADIFGKTEKLATEGLDLVFGFEHRGKVTLNIYAPKVDVKFNASEGGSVNKESVTLVKGASIGDVAEVKAKTGYKFMGWVADKDIKLSDDKEIKAGSNISEADLKTLTVDDKISFTAKFEKTDDKEK